jgi:hypothetical protein
MVAAYQLRCEIKAHDEDVSFQHSDSMAPVPHHMVHHLMFYSLQVRGVCICDTGLVTSSRDQTVKVWVESDARCFQLLNTLVSLTCCATETMRRHGHLPIANMQTSADIHP